MTILQLLKLEYYKFKSKTVVLLLLGFFTVLTPFLIFLGKRMFKDVPPPLPSSAIFYQFPTVWDYQGYVGSWLVFFFLGYLSVYIVTSDVASKTMRQNIITGMTRKEYFLGKVYAITAISLLATVLYTISTLIIGMIHTDSWTWSMALDMSGVLRYFLMAMGHMAFGLMIGFLIRKGGLAIFLYFVYGTIIEMILKWGVTFNILVRNDSWNNNLANYWPMNVMEDLHPNPWYGLPQSFMKFGIEKDVAYDLLLPKENAIIAATIYIALFLGFAYWRFKKKDV